MKQQLNKKYFYLLLDDIDKSKYWEFSLIRGGEINGFTKFRIEFGCPAKEYAEKRTELVCEGRVKDYRKKDILLAKYKRWAVDYFKKHGIPYPKPIEITMYYISSSISEDGIEYEVSENKMYQKNDVLMADKEYSIFDESSLKLSQRSSGNFHWMRIASYDKKEGMRLVKKANKEKVKKLKIYHKQYLENLSK